MIQKGLIDYVLLKADIEAMKSDSENCEGKISFELNKHGLVNVKSVEMSETIKY